MTIEADESQSGDAGDGDASEVDDREDVVEKSGVESLVAQPGAQPCSPSS